MVITYKCDFCGKIITRDERIIVNVYIGSFPKELEKINGKNLDLCKICVNKLIYYLREWFESAKKE